MRQIFVKEAVILVTGSNRGIGRALVKTALEQGAIKIYAAARNVDQVEDLVDSSEGKIVPLQLDVTDVQQVETAARRASDVNLLINNAGLALLSSFTTTENSLEHAKRELDVNYFGVLRVARAFAPILKINGGGALVNVISVAGFSNFPFAATYSASKAAAHSLTQGLRAELQAQGTFVAGVYPGPVDTDMAKEVDMDKESPEQVAKNVYQSLTQGAEDIFPDKYAVEFSEAWKKDAKAVEKENAQFAQQPS